MRLAPLIVSLLLTCSAAAADHVELHLSSGQVVEGEVVRQDATQVVVKSAYIGRNGAASSVTLGYKRADITSMRTVKEPEDDYRDRAAAAKTAGEHAALAAWCQARAMPEHAAEQAARAVALDPAEPTAPALLARLGRVQVDGAWVVEADWLAKQGKVRYHGTVMTTAEAESLQKQATADQDRDARRKELDQKTAWISVADQRLEKLTKRAAAIDAELAAAATAIDADQAAMARETAAKAAYDADLAKLDKLRAANTANNYPGGVQIDTTPERDQTERSQRVMFAARREAAVAKADLVQRQSRQKSLENEKALNAKQTIDLQHERDAAAAAVEKARAELGAAKPD